MYTPRSFRISDREEQHAFIAAHGFATLVTNTEAGLLATHLPLMLDPAAGRHGALLGHMARANPHWREFRADTAASLAVFHGPHAYISPSWDVTPIVPTWNYAAVHVYGRPAPIDDDARVTALLDDLVASYESKRDDPWRPTLPAELRASLQGAIVGFEIPIVKIEAKYKLSQNRAPEDQQSALEGLAAAGGANELVALWRRVLAAGGSPRQAEEAK